MIESTIQKIKPDRNDSRIKCPVILMVRAKQLGCSRKSVGSGSDLGLYVLTSGFKPLQGHEICGMYSVNVFRPSIELDNSIIEFSNRMGQ